MEIDGKFKTVESVEAAAKEKLHESRENAVEVDDASSDIILDELVMDVRLKESAEEVVEVE